MLSQHGDPGRQRIIRGLYNCEGWEMAAASAVVQRHLVECGSQCSSDGSTPVQKEPRRGAKMTMTAALMHSRPRRSIISSTAGADASVPVQSWCSSREKVAVAAGAVILGPDPNPVEITRKTLLDFSEFWIRPMGGYRRREV